jgi:hypothetical protein
MLLPQLNVPFQSLHIRTDGSKPKIWDAFRSKWVILSPEEWVRQQVLWHLVNQKEYPKTWIAVEREININGLRRRFDALVFDRQGHVMMLIEFKATHIPIDTQVLNQIVAYNFEIMAPFVLLSNGLQQVCAQLNLEEKKYQVLNEIPYYNSLGFVTE